MPSTQLCVFCSTPYKREDNSPVLLCDKCKHLPLDRSSGPEEATIAAPVSTWERLAKCIRDARYPTVKFCENLEGMRAEAKTIQNAALDEALILVTKVKPS
jgi:hypothetical protein